MDSRDRTTSTDRSRGRRVVSLAEAGWFAAACALVAVLIPYPGLIWVSLIGLGAIYIVTPTKPRERAAQRSRTRGH
jgi:hypothetical protein